MNQIVQQSMLSPHPLIKAILISLLFILGCVSCSKNETLTTPGKPVNTTRNFQFDITPANKFDEEILKQISLKLRLSISGINIHKNAKELLWDTIISKENLYEFTYKPGEIINTTITASPDLFGSLVFNYVIIYNHHGSLVTRAETERVTNDDAGKLIVKL